MCLIGTPKTKLSLRPFKRGSQFWRELGNAPVVWKRYSELLWSLPRSSTEAESSFSSMGVFVTKLRLYVGDIAVDTLCFP